MRKDVFNVFYVTFRWALLGGGFGRQRAVKFYDFETARAFALDIVSYDAIRYVKISKRVAKDCEKIVPYSSRIDFNKLK